MNEPIAPIIAATKRLENKNKSIITMGTGKMEDVTSPRLLESSGSKYHKIIKLPSQPKNAPVAA